MYLSKMVLEALGFDYLETFGTFHLILPFRDSMNPSILLIPTPGLKMTSQFCLGFKPLRTLFTFEGFLHQVNCLDVDTCVFRAAVFFTAEITRDKFLLVSQINVAMDIAGTSRLVWTLFT